MKELHSGYVCGALWKAIQDGALTDDLDWRDVVRRLSHFVIDHEIPAQGDPHPIVSVLTNLLCRGLPTLPSLYVEKKLERLAGVTWVAEIGNREVSRYESWFDAINAGELFPLLERALCTVSTDAVLSESPGFRFPDFGSGDDNTAFDSKAEEDFWNGPLAQLLGPGGMQLALRQRPLETIGGNDFVGQKVDVAVQFPGSFRGGACEGIVFEVDGPQHRTTVPQDQRRDEAGLNSGWARTYRHQLWQRIAANAPIHAAHQGVQSMLAHPYLRRVQENMACPLHQDPLGRRARLVVLFPFAVARIQRVILQLLLANELSLDEPVWNIVVIDRDGLPEIGKTAGRDLRRWMRKLWLIHEPGTTLPVIRVHDLHRGQDIPVITGQIDAVLDVSVEMRYGVTQPEFDLPPNATGARRVVIRSGYYRRQEHREILFGAPQMARSEGAPLHNALSFVLRNVFRKVDFRPKQIEIIERALRNESVIALLPTGAGKSITYQIPALLQNGIVIVVDPIKSLMKDQDDNLKALGISASTFINSMTTSKERRDNTQRMQAGAFKFVFVSPERFIIREFREALNNMRNAGRVYCAYVVVDEAHCVSEWGHDFRTAYLRLGANARRFCPIKVGTLPLLALTGTASYEVLDDIQIELGHHRGNSDISVRPDSMERKNLNYHVVQLSPQPQIPRNASDYLAKDIVGNAKLATLPNVIDSMLHSFGHKSLVDFMGHRDGSGLIFCPHARWVHGAEFVRAALCNANPEISGQIGVYHGSAEDNGKDDAFDPVQTQDDFKRGALKILACTKAFGMGIDKPDVRFTLHYNIPPSLESFYQEAGRAGRDGESAQCWILHSGTKHPAYPTSVDHSINQSFHAMAFPGMDIEEGKLIEILEENRVPGRAPVQQLSEMLFDETGVDYTAKTYHPDKSGTFRVYINTPNDRNARVFINVPPSGQLDPQIQTGFPGEAQVLDLAIDWLGKNKPTSALWRDWIFAPPGLCVEPGLEELLGQTLAHQGSLPVVVFFENGYLEEIAAETGVGVFDVRKAFKNASDAKAFNTGISKLVKFKWGADWVKWLDGLFLKIRLREHTFRAIYRLTLLGAVEDFEADYAGGCLTVWLRGQEPGSYTKALEKYIGSYAPMDVSKYLALASESAHGSELRRSLHALMAFVYARIAKQRVEALNIMEQTALRGVDRPEEFKEAVTYFFDSSYLPVLRPHLNNYSDDLVFEICETSGGSSAKMSHLLGACNRLLPENPDNGALHAMRAFAIALLGYSDHDVIVELQAAVDCFIRYWGWLKPDQHKFLLRMRNQLSAVTDGRFQIIDGMLINEHAAWLHQFSAKHSVALAQTE